MKNILILGANSDIAKATAHEYASNGYNIILASRNSVRLNDFVHDLSIRSGMDVKSLEFDVLDIDHHQSFIRSLECLPDGVISAVGYLGTQENSETNTEELMRVTNTNYTAIACFFNVVAPLFCKRGRGFIVGISSVAGDRGRSSNYIYGASKAAFSAYLSGLRQSLGGRGVHVLTVKPGFVDTAMTEGMDLPEKLTASPQKVAKDIFNAQNKGRSIVYTMPIWLLIMMLVKITPEFIFKRLKL